MVVPGLLGHIINIFVADDEDDVPVNVDGQLPVSDT
jgi:hypothetical protein